MTTTTLGRQVVKAGLRKLGLLEHAKAVRELLIQARAVVQSSATVGASGAGTVRIEHADPSHRPDLTATCPVCGAGSTHFRAVDAFEFFTCNGCGVIHLDPVVLDEIDQGRPVVEYRADYWEMETQAALERARGVAIARLAEAIYLARRPVELALDIGTGTGAILDEIVKVLPNNGAKLYGVEKFPPAAHSASKNYVVGDLKQIAPMKFDAGLCMEVIEHLTPKMLRGLLQDLSERSNSDACYVFNTGLAAFVRSEDPGYIDPVRRGHIMFWTVDAVNALATPYGFTASQIPGRTWAFLLEKRLGPALPVAERLYSPLPENKRFLGDGSEGWSLASLIAFEALRAYYYSSRQG